MLSWVGKILLNHVIRLFLKRAHHAVQMFMDLFQHICCSSIRVLLLLVLIRKIFLILCWVGGLLRFSLALFRFFFSVWGRLERCSRCRRLLGWLLLVGLRRLFGSGLPGHKLPALRRFTPHCADDFERSRPHRCDHLYYSIITRIVAFTDDMVWQDFRFDHCRAPRVSKGAVCFTERRSVLSLTEGPGTAACEHEPLGLYRAADLDQLANACWVKPKERDIGI